MNRWAGTPTRVLALYATATLGAAGLTAFGGTNVTQASSTHHKTFSEQGAYVWTVPKGVTKVTFDVFGASGGNVTRTEPGPIVVLVESGGAGGEAKATFVVKAGETFEIVVGGAGAGLLIGNQGGGGGYNGGGSGGTVSNGNTKTGGGAGGGGASDVRIGGVANGCAASQSCSLENRILVGGAGGGGGYQGGVGGDGGNGGGSVGVPGGPSGTGGGGGTQVAGGYDTGNIFFCDPSVPECYGQFGQGDGGLYGGGGGGWYGGGGGGDHNGGGGGSGFASVLAASASFPGGTQFGDGKVVITWVK